MNEVYSDIEIVAQMFPELPQNIRIEYNHGVKDAIQIKNVSVNIDKNTILSNVSASIPPGKITGLLGPSGAGKTTLIRSIVGLQRPSSGSLFVLDQKAGTASLRHAIGYVTQAPSVYNDLTVNENLRYFAALIGAEKDRVGKVMDEVGLSPFSKRLTSTLSGGQKARLSLAAALLGNPKALLLDEPTVGLDPVLRKRLWDHFHTLAKGGVTLLISSHVMDEASRCDMLLFIRDGKILVNDTPRNVMKRTKTHDLEKAFLRLAEKENV